MFSVLKKFCKLLLGLWLIGIVWFKFLVPTQLDDDSTKADAIVVLTGSSNRIATGIKLLENAMAPRLLISGVRPGVNLQKILHRNNISGVSKHLQKKIELDHEAYDTFSNGIETHNWVNKYNINSIRLVTANYHMPRSLLIFKQMMPHVKVIQHPVLYDLDWKSLPALLAQLSLFIKEYMKYTVVLFIQIGNK
jgi:uncharacterized SAM-binding protein YcdF (DUF218 family)